MNFKAQLLFFVSGYWACGAVVLAVLGDAWCFAVALGAGAMWVGGIVSSREK